MIVKNKIQHSTLGQNRKKHRINSHPIIHFPTSERVSEVSKRCEQTDERVAQYFSLYFRLFWPTVPHLSPLYHSQRAYQPYFAAPTSFPSPTILRLLALTSLPSCPNSCRYLLSVMPLHYCPDLLTLMPLRSCSYLLTLLPLSSQ